MVLTETSGTTVMDGSVDVIVDDTPSPSPAHYSARIDLTNMAAGDTITIKYYTKANNVLILEVSFTYTGVQTQPSIFIPYVPTDEFKVTAIQTAGVNRTLGWTWFKVQ